MKQLLLTVFSGVILSAMIPQPVLSQAEPAYNRSILTTFHPASNLGLLLHPNAESLESAPIPSEYVHEKVLRSFRKIFRQPINATWYHTGKKQLLAEFNLDGRKTRALFGTNGAMEYAVSYGLESSLPVEERSIIRSLYPEFTIGSVCEVTGDGKKVWIVNLEDAKSLVIAQMIDGAVNELNHYHKQLPQKKQRKGQVIIPW